MKTNAQSPVMIRLLLILSLAVCIPLYFKNALQYSVPMGYAGLFTQMAEQISDTNFRLPLTSPFYGPGGIPFAYPPFSLYGLAILIKLTGKYFIFLRLLPPLLGLLAFIPLFFLTLELSDSPLAAASSVLIAATSTDIYIAHAWAAGIVRAPAFLFTLLAVYFFSRHSRAPSKLNIILTGIFWGLSILTHLEYAVFGLGWIAFITLFRKNFVIAFKDAFIAIFIGLCIALVWIILMLLRYGSIIFLNAFNSHGNTSFLDSFGNFQSLLNLLGENLASISSNVVIVILALVGFVSLLYKKQYVLPLFYVFILLIFRGERFGFLLGSILAGIGLSVIAIELSSILRKQTSIMPRIGIALIVVPILGYIGWGGFVALSAMTPKMDASMLELADDVQAHVSQDQTYLALVAQDEAEWLPFLFQREPFVAQWGSEWLGTYYQQARLMSLFRSCQKEQDWSCVKAIFDEMNVTPGYIITYAFEKKINEQLLGTDNWEEVYANKRYILWQQNN